jgi:hypothetical protein
MFLCGWEEGNRIFFPTNGKDQNKQTKKDSESILHQVIEFCNPRDSEVTLQLTNLIQLNHNMLY